jgi:hypothetical protein
MASVIIKLVDYRGFGGVTLGGLDFGALGGALGLGALGGLVTENGIFTL